MPRNAKLVRIYRTLSVTRRARAVLRRLKRGSKPDDLLLRTMPAEQVAGYNHAIDVLTAIHNLIPSCAHHLLSSLDGLRQRRLQLLILRGWVADLDFIQAFVRSSVGEPITLAEYREREAAVTRTDDNEPDNEGGAGGTRGDRRVAARINELQQVAAWTRISWERAAPPGAEAVATVEPLHYPSVPKPALAAYFEVVPDWQADLVPSSRAILKQLETIVGSGPNEVPNASPRSLETTITAELVDEARARWHELRCLELVVGEVAQAEFEGEDPLLPKFRRQLTETRNALVAIHDGLEYDGVAVELDEPAEAEVAVFRSALRRTATHYHRLCGE